MARNHISARHGGWVPLDDIAVVDVVSPRLDGPAWIVFETVRDQGRHGHAVEDPLTNLTTVLVDGTDMGLSVRGDLMLATE